MNPETKAQNPARAALIFPPAMQPTGPPLGVASLAAYLRREAPGCQVEVFDLNLAFFEQAVAWMMADRLRVRLKGMDKVLEVETILKAWDFLRGRQGLDAFLDPGQYELQARAYLRFTRIISGLFDSFCRRLVLGLDPPPLAGRFMDELLEPVIKFAPHISGISLLYSQQLYFALALGQRLKASGSRVVLGGATLSVMPRPAELLGDEVPVTLGRKKHPLDTRPLVDGLILGEGELAMAALAKDPAAAQGVPGLIRRGDDGLHESPPQPAGELDALPAPDFSGLALERYHSPRPVLPYLSSRGCYWGRCAFCTHPKTYFQYREESVAATVRKLSALARLHGTSAFALADEMIHPKRLLALTRALGEAGLELDLAAYAKPTAGFSKDKLDEMAGGGLRVVMWGVESGSQKTLDAMDKGNTAAEAGRVLDQAHLAGIWNLVFILFGFPGETREDWDRTMEFLSQHAPAVDAISKSRFVLMPGSRVFESPEDFGLNKIRDRQERDPIQVAYDYEVKQGLDQRQVDILFQLSQPKLDALGRSRYFGVLRDHLLIHAAHEANRAPRKQGDGHA